MVHDRSVRFDHPANRPLIKYLKRGWDGSRPENVSAPPTVYDLHRNCLGTHPDLADRLWKEICTRLPEECGWVVYGRPALVHARTGIIFAFGGGTHTYALRLPAGTRAEARKVSPRRVVSYPGTQSRFDLDLDQLGEEWILGGWFQDEESWCLAAYVFAG